MIKFISKDISLWVPKLDGTRLSDGEWPRSQYCTRTDATWHGLIPALAYTPCWLGYIALFENVTPTPSFQNKSRPIASYEFATPQKLLYNVSVYYILLVYIVEGGIG